MKYNIYKKMKVINLDEAMSYVDVTNTFDSIISYTYTYQNDDTILFESNVIDDIDDTDITLDYLIDIIPKRISIPSGVECNLVIQFTYNNCWVVYYKNGKDKYCETYGTDLIKVLQEIYNKSKIFYKNY